MKLEMKKISQEENLKIEYIISELDNISENK